MTRTLRCYAEGGPGDWEAICLDLDIAVQGETFEEVYRSLGEAIALYGEAVSDLPADERARLVQRPSPLSVRLRFLGHVLGSVFADRGDSRERHDFTMPAAA